MTLLSFCGVAILACVLCLVLKETSPEWARMVALAAGLIVVAGALSRVSAQWQTLSSLLSLGIYGTLFTLLAKTMGVAILVETVADICRDAGQESLAARLVFLGKTEILLFALPLMQELLSLANEVLA